MAGSSVFPHYVFLKNLGKDNLRDRIQRVRLMNVDTMKALSKKVHFILMNYVPPLSYDQRAFQTSPGNETFQQSNRLSLEEKGNAGTISLADSQTSS